MQPGETVGIIIDLNDNFPIGRDIQFKLTTTNGAVFLDTVVMGMSAGLGQVQEAPPPPPPPPPLEG